MKLSIGIVGLPNVGKSTLFRILTKQNITIANYPFATIDPNVGVVAVPDERVDKLAELSKSKKKIPAVVEFYDIAGLVKGANTGEGLGNQFLSHIRDTQVIVLVVRVFQNPEIIHVESHVDAVRDFDIIQTELALKDLDTVEKRLKKLEGEARTGEKMAVHHLDILQKVQDMLRAGEPIAPYTDEEIVKELFLLSAKKQIVLANGAAQDVPDALRMRADKRGAEFIVADLVHDESVPALIQGAYRALGLMSFFTTGEDETRAWTIPQGAKAPQAAGVIHTDFEKNFIRAEVIHAQKLMEAGDWNRAKQKGWIRLEGKEYVIQDGDVIVVRHG